MSIRLVRAYAYAASYLKDIHPQFMRTIRTGILVVAIEVVPRAKGVNERTVVLRHAFRNALIPIATLAALDFGAVFGGAIITETVFGWQGMGQLFNQALPKFDINQVMGFFVVTAVAVLVFNLLADLSYAFLDPRVRLS